LIRFQQNWFKQGGETLQSEIHKLIMLISNKEELPHQWKKSLVVPIHKKGDKTDCSNYRGISLLSLHWMKVGSTAGVISCLSPGTEKAGEDL
jgi:hypothetical protein